MLSDMDLARTAALIGDETRARMLVSLLGGEARSAGELAHGAGVSPATASQHLARLLDGELVKVSTSGRHRFYSLANEQIAAALETLATISPARPARTLRQVNGGERLRGARSCYDHVAGRLGVLISDTLTEHAVITPLTPGTIGALLQPEHPIFVGLGLTRAAALPAGRRPGVRGCLDWTERRPHLAGGLGAAILTVLLDREWLARRTGERALDLTPRGVEGFAEVLGVDPGTLGPA